MSRKIKVVFIDWNGTLSTSKFFGHLEKENLELFTKIQSTMFGGELGHLINPWMVGDFDTEFVIKHLALRVNYPYEKLLSEFIKSCKNMYIEPKVLGLIKEIRDKDIQVVIATDNMDSFSRWTTPSLALNKHFDDILNSYDLKARKKDIDKNGKSLFFGKYLKDKNLKPEETILIDDSEDKEKKLTRYGVDYRRITSYDKLIHVLRSTFSSSWI